MNSFSYNGQLRMRYGHVIKEIGEGEFVIIPRGVAHKPKSGPSSTFNATNPGNELAHDSTGRMQDGFRV